MTNTQRTRRTPYNCSFCSKNQDQVQRLIAGPGGVYICDECVDLASKGNGERSEEEGLRCSFCGKSRRQVQYLAGGPNGVHICSECIALCQEIIDEEQPPHRP